MRDSAIQSWITLLSASGLPSVVARVGALAHQLEGALGGADPAHAVVDAARPEALLRDGEARRLRAPSRLVDRHAAVLVADLAVAAATGRGPSPARRGRD